MPDISQNDALARKVIAAMDEMAPACPELRKLLANALTQAQAEALVSLEIEF